MVKGEDRVEDEDSSKIEGGCIGDRGDGACDEDDDDGKYGDANSIGGGDETSSELGEYSTRDGGDDNIS